MSGGVTIAQVRRGWADLLDAEVATCPADSAVGEDCLATIDAADALLARLGDIAVLEPEVIVLIKDATARQCGVYWFG